MNIKLSLRPLSLNLRLTPKEDEVIIMIIYASHYINHVLVKLPLQRLGIIQYLNFTKALM